MENFNKNNILEKSKPTITKEIVFSILKREGWDSRMFKDVLERYHESCEDDAEKEIRLGNIRNPNGDKRMIAHRANIKCNIRKAEMTIELYKKGITNLLKQGMIEGLLEDLDAASQRPDTWDLAERIESLIEQVQRI